jgi:hypothetical protein
MASYVPNPDGDFDSWQANWATYAAANFAALGLTAGDVTAVQTAQTGWNTKYADHVAKQAAAAAARQAKDGDRSTYEGLLRSHSQQIQKRPGTTDAQRAALGITVPDTTGTPAGPPITAPVVTIETSQRLRHVINFSRTSAEGGGRGKPAGVRGCQIWMKIGAPAPASDADLSFVTEDTRSPHTIDFENADGGKLVFYWCRWVNTRGETGPWAAPVSATVVA